VFRNHSVGRTWHLGRLGAAVGDGDAISRSSTVAFAYSTATSK